MTHDIPSEGRPSAVTGQPETPVASRVDERACSRPAAAAPGAAEGISAAPGISPADHPLGVETPEQAARYWQMRHAEAQIEIAKAKHRNLELQVELAEVSKRHVNAAIETQQDLKSLTAARAEVERLKAALAEEKRLHAAAEEARRCAIATLADCHELVDQAAIPGLERDRMQSLQVRISGLIERATKPVHVAPPPADTASCEQHLQERIEELEADVESARAEIAVSHAALDRAGVHRDEPCGEPPRMLPLTPQRRIDVLAANRDMHQGLLAQVRGALFCRQRESVIDVAYRRRQDADLLAWLDQVGDLVVLDLRVGPVFVKRGATGTHKTLRDALEAIRNSEIESAVRKEAVE